ncbi:hypothetical protein [Haliscomenobacter hydrossis]|uniref:Uncharacterized protein n=1 Tax=Haliscomenobacter hydrossis (strain ATCC 27775 / DSM 1100 / LMG 10767 / O) TaxID=760192 RepID=F4L837_HALH1|nr:hypothetical protein [Haliscomenobacter hydrossis]AEE54545.1 hypothetical protein Halhy_6730 [Haliscomenobacter hydrossis DSM 1100]
MRHNDEITLVLRQHTPVLIAKNETEHFLRSTELKPKLNRFLLAQYQGIHQKSVPEDWLLGRGNAEHQALDFALYGCSNPEFVDGPDTNVVGAKMIPRFAVDKEEAFSCKFQTDHPGLLQFTREHLSTFFLVENFGRRQSKGYGQFSLACLDDEALSLPPVGEIGKVLYDFYQPGGPFYTFKINDNVYPTTIQNGNQWGVYTNAVENQEPNDLRRVYGRLKAGINYIDKQNIKHYEKSFLMRYFNSADYPGQANYPGWEKKAIKVGLKEKFPEVFRFLKYDQLNFKAEGNQIQDIHPKYAYDESWYIRAMLGLAENFEFLMHGPFERMKVKIDAEDKKGPEQFASPLRIKIFQDFAFFVPLLIPLALFDVPFNFSARFVKKPPQGTEPPKGIDGVKQEMDFALKTPAEFDLVAFLDFAIELSNQGGDEVKPLGLTKITSSSQTLNH